MNKIEYLKDVFGSELKPRARLVLQCLVYHANQEGTCFPSIKTIAAECGYGLSTVKRALNDLCEAGYIEKTVRFDERKNGGQTSNLYTLTKAEQPAPTPDTEQTAIIEEPHAKNVPPRNNCATSYTYSFSTGMKKLLIGSYLNEKTVQKIGGLEGSPILYPLESTT